MMTQWDCELCIVSQLIPFQTKENNQVVTVPNNSVFSVLEAAEIEFEYT